MAERTGLEPATPGVTGRYSNQLNYRSMRFVAKLWWVERGSNPRPSPCKGDALPTELSTREQQWGRIILSLKIVSIDFLASKPFTSTITPFIHYT